ncbi:MAG: efflux RND transporter permease subunit [Candidatus Latescibacterota bacterium]|nr:MAG: efflux RND transporter permease subunit [Candidatus Latescibacterota bacterium]
MIEHVASFGLRNRLLIAVVAVLVMFGGYYTYTRLPVDAFPDVSPNLVQVFTVTEGLAPEEVEKFVTYPVEAAMTGLPDVKRIRSVSNFGLSVVNVYFKDKVDIYFARQLVNERLQEARDQIPEGFGDPEMGPISTGMGQVLFYYLEDTTGEYSLEELRTVQDWLVKFHLQTVPGVTEVLGIGGFEKQFHVIVHPEELLRFDVTIGEIIERVTANNVNVGAQFIEKNAEEFVVRSVGLATDIEDLRSIVIKTDDGRPIYLDDVADIGIGGAIRRGVQTRNGLEEVVAGMVIKLFGTNSSTVIAAVEDKLEEINRILPDGVRIVPYYEQKSLVAASVKTVTNALIQGIVLVALVLLVFMGGLRPSIVVAISIPFSVLFAFLLMGRLGISANLMSLGGLAIAIGMMVDGTIVMVENVDRLLRHARPADSRLSIIDRACREVGRPIVFAITTIIVVFLPLFTLQGVEGKTFRPLAYTVALAMLGSLVFALALAPLLAHVMMRRPRGVGEGKRDAPVIRALLAGYHPVVRHFVRRRWVAVTLAGVLVVVGLLIFPRLGSEFTPKLREGTIIVRLTMAPSISLKESTRTTLIVERRLTKIPEVREVVTRIGRGEIGAHTDPINRAEIYVILAPKNEWRSATSQEEIEQVIRDELGEIPGVLVNLTQPIEMTVDELLEGVRAELAIKLFGDDLDVLKEKADEVAAIVRTVRGAADVQIDQVSGTPQLLIRVDRQAIARYGVNVADVQRVVRAAIGGEVAGQIFEGVRRFDILVRYEPVARDDADAIRHLLITTPDGARVPLDELATVEEIVGPRQITREENQRFIAIQCNVVGRDIGTFVEEAQTAIVDRADLPPGYLVSWGGQFRLQQEANRRLAVVVPVTLLGIFLLLFTSFRSLRNALLILLNIPLALVGGVAALWLSGQNLSVPASVGFIALFGIALENGMVLVTYLNQLLGKGMDLDEASIRGACLRLRPVLMTAMTTALGLIPLLLATGTGSEVQRPLATVVIGGLVTSTLLTLVVIPALYKWFSVVPEGEVRS